MLVVLAIMGSTLPELGLGQAIREHAGTLSVSVRMVEVYAAVLDGKGRYVPGLEVGQFEVIEEGRPQNITVFETQTSALTLALLIDTTGSMVKQLPHVKNAVATLLSSMKPQDSFGLFAFTSRLKVLQTFTQDRDAALAALLRTRAVGTTALFDSLAQLGNELTKINGKKAILLFTDGADNASVLSMEDAVRTVKKVGIPIYSVAQGEALSAKKLMKTLEEISQSSGGVLFEIRKHQQISEVFQEIGQDLQNLYLLGYYPAGREDRDWRAISVQVRDLKGAKVRAKEGYLP